MISMNANICTGDKESDAYDLFKFMLSYMYAFDSREHSKLVKIMELLIFGKMLFFYYQCTPMM